MTKLAQVSRWLILFLLLFSVLNPQHVSAGFGDLIKPIPDDSQIPASSTIVPKTYDQLQLVNNTASVTFGDLLNKNVATPTPEITPIATDEAQIAAKTAQFKALLANLENSYRQSLAEFKAKEQTLPVNDLTQVSPSPYIPVPTLIAGVNQLAANSQQQTANYPTPTLTDKLLLATLPTSVPQPTATPVTPILGELTQNPVKTHYTIALLGDSMTDTLGRNLPQLRNLLQAAYPNYTFSLLNYGQGGTDLESGLRRLTNSTNYLGTDYPPLLSYKPDILVVESFAYNHWSGEKFDLDRQWLDFAKITDTVRQNSPETKIILAATIAPNKDIFGDGVLNWNASLKENATLIIKAYLQNLVNFATSQHYPLADAYHPSLESDGQGIAGYINSSDHLHPSGDGAYLYSQKIVEAIKNNALIN